MMPRNTATRRPAPEEFDDYRAYLRAMVAHLKETQRGFSYRRFSQRAGYSTSNFLKLVADGKRNLSQASIGKFAKGLGLSAKEAEAFESLVLMGQAGSDAERNEHFAKLRRTRRPKSPAVQLRQAQYDVYTLWCAIPIREMMFHSDFQEDADWIVKRFRTPVTPGEVRKALQLLEQTGLATRNAEGRLVPAAGAITSPPVIRSLAARNYHRALLERSLESLDALPPEERNITSLTVSMTKEQYDAVCKELDQVRRNFLLELEKADAGDEPQEVYTIGFQVVPLTRGKKQ